MRKKCAENALGKGVGKMKSMRIFFIVLFAVLLTGGALLPRPGALAGGGDSDVVVVRIKNLAFVPSVITVRPGTTVRWINEDPFAHDVTSGSVVSGRRARQVKRSRTPDGRFRSGAYGGGGAFEQTFTEPGDYPYFCTIHPIMTGVVKVVR
jgi:plastocyanin